MVKSFNFTFVAIVSRGRTAAVLAGNKIKKRKFNEISNEEVKMMQEEDQNLRSQLNDL